jgi:glycosyltransferase involved in cell wall biosynthesis
MISIVICSRNSATLEAVSKSIEQTIGVPHEIIAIDNRNAQMGICAAYNNGAAKAIFDVFCFMHEDIAFETDNWGQRVIDHLKDPKVGLIGNIGGDPKHKVPESNNVALYHPEAYVISHSNDNSNEPVLVNLTSYPLDDSPIKQVTCVDGMWMCTRRDVYNQFQFDEKTFKGFHAYDMDYSLQVVSHYKVCVVFDVLMHHFSSGNFDRKYMDQQILLSRKWKAKLPYSVRNLSKVQLSELHWKAMDNYISTLAILGYSFSFRLRELANYASNKYFKINPFLKQLKNLFR